MATVTFIISLIFFLRIESVRYLGETIRQIRFFDHIYFVSSGFYYFLMIGIVVLGLLVIRELYSVKKHIENYITQ